METTDPTRREFLGVTTITDYDPTRREFLGLTGAAGASAVLGGLLLPEPAAAAPAPEPEEYRFDTSWEVRAHSPLYTPGRGLLNQSHVLSWPGGESWCFAANADGDRWYIRAGMMWRHRQHRENLFSGTLAEAKAETERFTLEMLKRAAVALEKVVYAVPAPH